MKILKNVSMRILILMLCFACIMSTVVYAEDVLTITAASYNPKTGLVSISGSSTGATVAMYLLYPGKTLDDVSSHSNADPTVAHIWQITAGNGEYAYSFEADMSKEGDYKVIVKSGNASAEKIVEILETKTGNIYNLPTDTYGALTGTTTRERFIQARAELPKEMPVYTPLDIEGAVQLFVSPQNGDDANNGTIDSPFKTVERAVAVSKTMDLSGGCVIYLRGGVYDRTQRILLQGISGYDTNPYMISAYNGENVVFTDGYRLDGSAAKAYASTMAEINIPVEVKNKIRVFDLKNDYGITEYTTADKFKLTIDDSSYSVARWPNAGTVKMREYTGADATNGVIDAGSQNGMEFCIEDVRPFSWQNTGDIMIIGSLNAEYWSDAVTVKSFNPAKRSVITNEVISHSSTYGAAYDDKNTFYWTNIIEELDTPGEFYIDKTNGLMYVYPIKEFAADSEIILSCSPNYTQYISVINSNSKNVVVNGITFKASNRQNLMSINNAQNILVQNCTFKDSIGGIIFGGNTEFCGVINSSFENINSFYPIVTSKPTVTSKYTAELRPQYNFVQNNYFYNCSSLIIRGVGDIISHNYISNTDGGAIYCDSSNEIVIEYNEIVCAHRSVDDSGAIYSGGREAASAGVHIRGNYIHDAAPNAADAGNSRGIYLDDLHSNAYVYNNVLESGKTIFIHGGSDNTIYNNVIIDGIHKGIADSENHMYDSHLRKSIFVPGYLAEGAQSSAYLDETDTDNYIDVLSDNSPYKKRYPAMSEWSEQLKTRIDEYRKYTFLRGQGMSLHRVTYTNGTKANLDTYLTSPRYNYYDKNVIVKGVDMAITETGMISADIGTNMYLSDTNPFANGYNDTAYAQIRQTITDFESIDVSRAGIITQNSDSDYANNTWQNFKELEAPKLISPVNGGTAAQGDVFRFNGNAAAAKYVIEISEKSDFSDLYYTDTVYNLYCTPTAEFNEGTTYYWRVKAIALSDNIIGTEKISDTYSFVAGGSPENPPLGVTGYSLDSGTVTTYLYNYASYDHTEPVIVIAALYKDNALKGINAVNVSAVNKNDLSALLEIPVEGSDDYDYARLYVWKNDNSLSPLTQEATFN